MLAALPPSVAAAAVGTAAPIGVASGNDAGGVADGLTVAGWAGVLSSMHVPSSPASLTLFFAALGSVAVDAAVTCSGRAAARCRVRSTLRVPAGDVVGDGRALRRDPTGAAAAKKVAVDGDGVGTTAAPVAERRKRAALATFIAAVAAIATTPGGWPSVAAGASRGA